ncbi:MAG TPA: type II secretion system protein N [Steroidobacteraceae bacterium]|nr:type II secretion system protein N [Steroidobacteraceae bacterium]
MPRTLRFVLLAAAAFAVMLLARLPASWVVPRTGALACASADGSVWRGACSGLTVARAPFGDLAWDLAPLRLLTGSLAAHVVLTHGPVTGSADVALRLGGRVELRNLVADLPLDPRQLPRLPPQLRGSVHTDLALARIEHGALTELKGRLEAHDLTQRTGHVTRLGSYAVTFPGGGPEPVGTVVDLGGPLAVQGTLRLTKQPGYVLEGTVAPRADAAPELVGDLQYLGSPDALGRRPFNIAGTL